MYDSIWPRNQELKLRRSSSRQLNGFPPFSSYDQIIRSSDYVAVTFNELKGYGYSMLSLLNRIRDDSDRLKSYMIIKTTEWPSIKNNKSLKPILLRNDFPQDTKVFYKRVSSNQVIWYIYQDVNGHMQRIFPSRGEEVPQELDL